MNAIVQSAFVVNGKVFATKAEAQEFIRRPQVEAALNVVTGKNAELTDWLLDNEDSVNAAFDVGTIRRVTKGEHAKLSKALEALKELKSPALAFLQENAGHILDSFRWPSVKRMDEAEKATAARNTLVAASGNEDLAAWIIVNKDAVMAAYKAGVAKRAVPEGAANGLVAYRARLAERKALEDAGDAVALAAFDAAEAERKTALAAEKAAEKATKVGAAA